jgi:hypothetical protein
VGFTIIAATELAMRQLVQAVQKTITITTATAKDTVDKMIDYSETILAIQTGKKKLNDLLTKRQFSLAAAIVDDLIIALIDLKWWLKKQNDNN